MNKITALLEKMKIQNQKCEESVEFNSKGEIIKQNNSALAWATRYHKQAVKLMNEKGMTTEEQIALISKIVYE